ncbi:hypothetical protein FCV25MIE_19436 [Fagus crenata]
MAWHGFVCREYGLAWLCVRRAWLGMAWCAESMAWHGFVCREHGLAWLYLEVAWLDMALFAGLHGLPWLYLEVAWLGMALRVVETYAYTRPREFELQKFGAYTSMMSENRDLCLHAARRA